MKRRESVETGRKLRCGDKKTGRYCGDKRAGRKVKVWGQETV